jgi:excisionase family DNA binding protein
VRQRAGIPAAPPPDPASELYTVEQAASELAVSGSTIYRWLWAGLLPAEQTTPGAPWRIRLSDQVRRRLVPEVPDGFLPLEEAAKALGVARQTVLHGSNAANSKRSRSPRAAARDFAFRFQPRGWIV